jgi:hypothetical protein
MNFQSTSTNQGRGTLRLARLNVEAGTFCGCLVALNDTFRLGLVTINPGPSANLDGGGCPLDSGSLVMSTGTWSALVAENQKGGKTPFLDVLEANVWEATTTMQTRMVDLSKGPKKTVDRRTVTRYSDDRVDYVCRGISDLVSQMSTLLAQPKHLRSDGSVAGVAKRYVELMSEMKALREAMLAADGHCEIAQQFVIALMGEDE